MILLEIGQFVNVADTCIFARNCMQMWIVFIRYVNQLNFPLNIIYTKMFDTMSIPFKLYSSLHLLKPAGLFNKHVIIVLEKYLLGKLGATFSGQFSLANRTIWLLFSLSLNAHYNNKILMVAVVIWYALTVSRLWHDVLLVNTSEKTLLTDNMHVGILN